MWRWLEKLQHRSLSQRRQLAFVGALSVTAIVAVMWVGSLPERFDALSQAAPVSVERDPALTGLFAGVRMQVGSLRAAMQDLTTSPEEAEQPASATSTTATSTGAASSNLTPAGAAPRTVRSIQIATTSTDAQ